MRVEGLTADDLPILEDLTQGLDGYGDVKHLREFEGSVQIGQEGTPQSETLRHETVGFRATSEDEHRVVQFKLSGFTFSRLAPYTTWEEVRDEARELWDQYAGAVEVDEVVRVALRYVNHIRLVQPVQDIETFFHMLPEVPDGLPQMLTNFLARVTIFEPETQFSAHVTHALVDDIDPDRIGVILDIDAFREGVFSVEQDDIWKILADLREFKNGIFFGALTERAVEMFE